MCSSEEKDTYIPQLGYLSTHSYNKIDWSSTAACASCIRYLSQNAELQEEHLTASQISRSLVDGASLHRSAQEELSGTQTIIRCQENEQCLRRIWEGTITLPVFERLLKESKIVFPMLTEEEINDKSKSSLLTKVIAFAHIAWFIVVEIILRLVLGKAVTQLEVTTAALAVVNITLYYFWIDKPLDVQCPIIIPSKVVEKQLIDGQDNKMIKSYSLAKENSMLSEFPGVLVRTAKFPIRLYQQFLKILGRSWRKELRAYRRRRAILDRYMYEGADLERESSLPEAHGMASISYSESPHGISEEGTSAIDSISVDNTPLLRDNATVRPLHRPEGSAVRSRVRDSPQRVSPFASATIALLVLITLPLSLMLCAGAYLGASPAEAIRASIIRNIGEDKTFSLDSVAKHVRGEELQVILTGPGRLPFFATIFHSDSDIPTRKIFIFGSAVGLVFAVIHALALRLTFPTIAERLIWEISTAILFPVCFAYGFSNAALFIRIRYLEFRLKRIKAMECPDRNRISMYERWLEKCYIDSKSPDQKVTVDHRTMVRREQHPLLAMQGFILLISFLSLYGFARVCIFFLSVKLLGSQPDSAFEKLPWNIG